MTPASLATPAKYLLCFFISARSKRRVFVLLVGIIIRQLLPARLHRKIVLAQGDERFARVGILDDEITGVAGKRPIFHRTQRIGTDADQFGDTEGITSISGLCTEKHAGILRRTL